MESLHVLYTGRQAPASLCKVRTGIEFVFGSRQYRILHVQPAIIGIHLPVAVDAVSEVGFHTPVLYLAGVDVLAQGRVRHDDVVPVDVVEVHPIGHGPSQKLPRKGEFIVHQALRFQIGVLWREHVHLPDGGVTESFAHHCFQFCLPRQMESQSPLGNPFRAYVRMVVYADTGVQ